MPYIILTATDENYPGHYGSYGIIKKQDYKCSGLFVRYEHTPTSPLTQETIYVYNDCKGYSSYSGNKLSLLDTDKYKDLSLEKAQVYFNRYDTEVKNPLLFVLFFEVDSAFNRYCKRSKFENEIKQNKSEYISQLDWYANEQEILTNLIRENDEIDELLMFDIGRTTEKSDGEHYNNNKIRVVEDWSGESELSLSAFKKYTHQPVNKGYGKRGCLTYKNQPLLDKDGKDSDRIQGEKYDSITVYFLSTTKLEDSDDKEEVPLLLELYKTSGQGIPEYFLTRKHEQGESEGTYYWEKLDRSNLEQFEVTRHLGDVQTDFNDHETKLLIEIFNSTKSALMRSVFVLIEKRGTYTKDCVRTAVKSAIPPIIPNPELSGFQPQQIIVNQRDYCPKLKQLSYRQYEHTIYLNSTAMSHNQSVNIQLRLLIPTSDGNGKYNEIMLYNRSKTNNDENREYFVFMRGIYTNTRLNVLFYGDDPRPLLVCYLGATYKPKSIEGYTEKWVNININSLTRGPIGQNDELLKHITEAVGFLNKVQLEKTQGMYEVQTFNGEKIEVKVTKEPVNITGNFCYTRIIHTPNGTGSGSKNFRLGDVVYTRESWKLDYTSGTNESRDNKWKPLLSVALYYHEKDDDYKKPLLLELMFKGGPGDKSPKEYYKPKHNSGGSVTWELDKQALVKVDSGGRNLIGYLDQIVCGSKKVVQVQIQKNTKGSYDLKVGQSSQPIKQFTLPTTGINKQIGVDEDKSSKFLNQSEYTCYKHKLTYALLKDVEKEVGGLKITIPNQLPYEKTISSGADQEICLYEIRPGNESVVKAILRGGINKDDDKDSLYSKIEKMLIQSASIYYSSCKGDLSVYFKEGDPRPLLMYLDGIAYRPLRLPKRDNDKYNYSNNTDCTKWAKIADINSRGSQDEIALVQLLNEVCGIENSFTAPITGAVIGLGVLTGLLAGLAFYKNAHFLMDNLCSLIDEVIGKTDRKNFMSIEILGGGSRIPFVKNVASKYAEALGCVKGIRTSLDTTSAISYGATKLLKDYLVSGGVIDGSTDGATTAPTGTGTASTGTATEDEELLELIKKEKYMQEVEKEQMLKMTTLNEIDNYLIRTKSDLLGGYKHHFEDKHEGVEKVLQELETFSYNALNDKTVTSKACQDELKLTQEKLYELAPKYKEQLEEDLRQIEASKISSSANMGNEEGSYNNININGTGSKIDSLAESDVVLPNKTCIKRAQKNKDEGNELIGAGNIELAIQHYVKVLQYCGKVNSPNEEEKETINGLRLASNLNLAMCYLKLDVPASLNKAVSCCTSALSISPGNTKALFRRAVAYEKLNDFDNALNDAKRGCEIDSGNQDFKNGGSRYDKKINRLTDRVKYAIFFAHTATKRTYTTLGSSRLCNSKETVLDSSPSNDLDNCSDSTHSYTTNQLNGVNGLYVSGNDGIGYLTIDQGSVCDDGSCVSDGYLDEYEDVDEFEDITTIMRSTRRCRDELVNRLNTSFNKSADVKLLYSLSPIDYRINSLKSALSHLNNMSVTHGLL